MRVFGTLHERHLGQQCGFTAMEVLVSLSVVAILAALAAPSLQGFVNEQRLGSTMNELGNDLNLARAEAIKRNARVLLCARGESSARCANTPDWQNGWLVCYDANSDDQCDATASLDPNPVKAAGPLHARLRLTSAAAIIRFNPIGSSNGVSTLTLTGTWADSTTRLGTVAASGSVSTRKN